MQALQETFWDGAQPATSFADGWRARVRTFAEMSEVRGGLLPRASIHDILGVSRQRVAELCNKGQLEEVNFCGTSFISGRSIEEHLEGEKAKGGRGIKRQTLWQKVVFSYHLGNAIAEIVVPD
jgi:hypothetical protein